MLKLDSKFELKLNMMAGKTRQAKQYSLKWNFKSEHSSRLCNHIQTKLISEEEFQQCRKLTFRKQSGFSKNLT